MRYLILICLVVLVGCKSPQEMILEAATGGKVDIQEGKVTVKGKDGQTMVVSGQDGEGSVTVTNEKGETASITGKDGTIRMASDKGVTEIGTGKVPEGFPLPLIDGAKVVQSSKQTDGKLPVYHLVAEAEGEPKAIADYYAKVLADKGFAKLQRNEHQMGGGAMANLVGKHKGVEVAVTVLKQENEAKTMLTIAWKAD